MLGTAPGTYQVPSEPCPSPSLLTTRVLKPMVTPACREGQLDDFSTAHTINNEVS